MNLAALLEDPPSIRPSATALVTTHRGVDTTVTYEELTDRAARVATLVAGEGIAAGDAVLVLVPMSADLYVVLLALWKLGAMAVFLDPSAGRDHVERCAAMLPLAAFVGTPRAHALRLESSALRHVRLRFTTGRPLPGATSLSAATRLEPLTGAAELGADAPALVTFTSGSTGLPKAAVRTHGFLATQHEVLARHIALEPGQVDLTTLPVFGLANLASGVTSVIPDADLRHVGGIDAGPVLGQVDRLGVTRAGASPAFLDRIATACELGGRGLPSLRRIYAGGAPVMPSLLRRLQRLAPQAEVVAVYGSTEAEPIAHVSASRITTRDLDLMRGGGGLLAGAPVPEIELRILGEARSGTVGPFTAAAFEESCLGAEGRGEIVVSGPHVLSGYLAGEGDSDTKFEVDGARWHRTGDAGYLDGDGRLWLLGRTGARIEDERGDLYPFAVECALDGACGVARTALASWGDRRVLVVEPAPGRRPRTAELGEAVAWAQLDDIVIVRHIPVDARHNAKVDYPALAGLLDDELG